MEAEGKSARHHPLHTPLLWLLLPMIAGYTLANFVWLPSAWAVAATGLLTIGFATFVEYRTSGPCLDKRTCTLPLLLIGGTLSFAAYHELRSIPTSTGVFGAERAPREATLKIQIEQPWRGGHETWQGGLAKVVKAPPLARLSPGQQIHFSLDPGKADHTSFLPGSIIVAKGALRPIRPTEDPDNPSFETFLIGQGVSYHLTQGVWLETKQPAPIIRRVLSRGNQFLESQLRRGLPEGSPLADVYTAMLLGKRAALSDSQADAFRKTGTMHFFAISGLHIGVIALTLAQILNLLRLPRLWVPVIGLSLLAIYVLITGAAPSAVRAFLMTVAFWLSLSITRQHTSLGAWCLAAFLILLLFPSQLWNVGFQLSYAVVASILLFGLPLQRRLEEKTGWLGDLPEDAISAKERFCDSLRKKLILLFSISLSAWLASTPLTMVYFGLFIPGAILLNICLVTLGSLTIITGVISMVSGILGLGILGGLLNNAAYGFLAMMTTVVHSAAAFPLTALPVPQAYTPMAYAGLGLFLAISYGTLARHRSAPPAELAAFAKPTYALGSCCLLAVALAIFGLV